MASEQYQSSQHCYKRYSRRLCSRLRKRRRSVPRNGIRRVWHRVHRRWRVRCLRRSEKNMAYARPLIEGSYGRDAYNRNDSAWAHPELKDFWAAGNADVVNMCCDESIPLEKRKKRLEKMICMSADMLESQGYKPFEGKDSTEADG